MPFPKETKVLVVDDYGYMARLVRAHLCQIGLPNVVIDSDGTEALGKLAGGSYGLVICDLVLNCPDGMDVLRAVRSNPTLAGLPFVIYTLDRSHRTLARLRAAGVSACLYKPFKVQGLADALETAWGAHRGTTAERPPLTDLGILGQGVGRTVTAEGRASASVPSAP